MKNLILLLLTITLLTSCKKKCDSCGAHQQCVDGVCQCQQWYEGVNCDTDMIDKFLGTFSGVTYKNSANPVFDTFTFKSQSQPNFGYLVNTDFQTGKKQEGGLSVLSSTNADYFQIYGSVPQILISQKKCGTAKISADGHDLTLTFSPISVYGVIDSNTLYTFIGSKQ